MNLIVGLGNPGNEYDWTRHNFGFLLLDLYAKIYNLDWSKPKFNALWLKSNDQLFIKPQDFYNNSGQSVRNFANFYKIPPEDIIVVCDDFELDFGRTRLRTKGSSGGNNGLRSVIENLGTSDFARLRLGTGNPDLRRRLGDTKFVLSRFTHEEKAQLVPILEEGIKKVADWAKSH